MMRSPLNNDQANRRSHHHVSIDGAPRRGGMDLSAVRAAYRRYAPTYDLFFGPVFRWGRLAAAARVNSLPGRTVLEVGVGTGLSLAYYAADKQMTGIDISPEMLAVAHRRAAGLGRAATILEMDAERLDFPDAHFDVVVACYVLSVTPDPQRCFAEMRRVCKPGGTVLICNHFTDERDRWLTKLAQPLSRQLGWRPHFSLADVLSDGHGLQYTVKRLPPLGLFTLVAIQDA
jgi:phosphatidylethanolamine/phosphatidyl-N-methylethanolamine N-methyltransferase